MTASDEKITKPFKDWMVLHFLEFTATNDTKFMGNKLLTDHAALRQKIEGVNEEIARLVRHEALDECPAINHYLDQYHKRVMALLTTPQPKEDSQ